MKSITDDNLGSCADSTSDPGLLHTRDELILQTRSAMIGDGWDAATADMIVSERAADAGWLPSLIRKYTEQSVRRKRSRAEKRRAFGSSVRAHVWDKTRGACSYCGATLNPFSEFTIDHVTPVSRGGTNDIGNLVPSCRSCNSRKGNR